MCQRRFPKWPRSCGRGILVLEPTPIWCLRGVSADGLLVCTDLWVGVIMTCAEYAQTCGWVLSWHVHILCLEPSHHLSHRPLVGGCSTSLIYHRTSRDSMITCHMVSELGQSDTWSPCPRYWNFRPSAYSWILPKLTTTDDEEDMAHT